MPRRKYVLNPDSLSFTEQKFSVKRVLKFILKLLLASLGLSITIYIIYSLFFYTPRERLRAKENEEMRKTLIELNERYERTATVLEDIKQRDRHIYRTIFESDLPRSEEQTAAQTITEMYNQVQSLGPAVVVNRTGAILNTLTREAQGKSIVFDGVIELALAKQEFLANVPSMQPIENRSLRKIAAPFGMRIHPFYKVLRMHNGVDFAASVGTPVLATAYGTVEQLIKSHRGGGNQIIIDHGNGYKTVYAHLDRMLVKKGQRVERGQEIGLVGNSGMSMAPHLHYEVIHNGSPVDPLHYFFMELDPMQQARIAQLATQRGQTLD